MKQNEFMKPLYGKYADTRKMLSVLMGVWLAMHLLMFVLSLICMAQQLIVFNVSLNVVTIVIAFLFSWYIINGTWQLAFLPMIGGVYTIFSAVTFLRSYSYTFSTYPLLAVYACFALLLGIAQIVIMLVVVALPRFKPYWNEYKTAFGIWKANKSYLKNAPAVPGNVYVPQGQNAAQPPFAQGYQNGQGFQNPQAFNNQGFQNPQAPVNGDPYQAPVNGQASQAPQTPASSQDFQTDSWNTESQDPKN